MENEEILMSEQCPAGESFSSSADQAECNASEEAVPSAVELMKELSSLRERVDTLHRAESVASELRALLSVIPNADISLLDEEAFLSIERGEGLICSYLLSERRRAAAEEKNKKNALSSIGEVRGGEDDLFSIDEIKSMDRKAVRRNFDKVMRSLEKQKRDL